jgi:signal transduction histidine kinase
MTSTRARQHLPGLSLFGVAVVVLGGLGVASAVLVLSDSLPVSGSLSGDRLSVAAGVIATLACATTSWRSSGAMRLSWAMFAVLMLCYSGGDALWIVFADADGSPPVLSFADVLYLVGLVPGALGLVLYPAARGWRQTWGPMLFDAALLTAAALLAIGVLVANEVVDASGSFREAFMLLVYPVTDVMMLSLVVLVLMRSVGQGRLDLVLLGTCFAVYAVADGGYAAMTAVGADTAGTLVDLAYVVGPLLLAAAAVHAATHPTQKRVLQRHLVGVVPSLLPDLTVLTALGLFVSQYRALDSTTWLLAAGALTLTGVRQLALTVDRQRLRTSLEDRVAARTHELAQLQEEYDNLETLKFEFVSAVSHELRTPLTAIRGSMEMLTDGDAGILPPPAQPVVEMALRGSERLSRLVDDIIDLERLARGTLTFHLEAHRLSQLLTDATGSLQVLARERGVRLVVEPTDEIVLGDADRIVQALVNLVGNALKFTPEGRSVTLSTTGRDEHVEVCVRDEGRGIPESHHEAIFDRFHQVERGDARDHNGAGLGLPITKYIVESHGGRVWVESTLGAGATFRFTLPRPVATPAVLPVSDTSSETLSPAVAS